LYVKLEINQGYTAMSGQPIIKTLITGLAIHLAQLVQRHRVSEEVFWSHDKTISSVAINISHSSLFYVLYRQHRAQPRGVLHYLWLSASRKMAVWPSGNMGAFV